MGPYCVRLALVGATRDPQRHPYELEGASSRSWAMSRMMYEAIVGSPALRAMTGRGAYK